MCGRRKKISPNLGRGWEVFIVNQDFGLTFKKKEFSLICFQMEEISGSGCIKLHEVKAQKMSDFFFKKVAKSEKPPKKGHFFPVGVLGKFHLLFLHKF
jgi:hypothetical protein